MIVKIDSKEKLVAFNKMINDIGLNTQIADLGDNSYPRYFQEMKEITKKEYEDYLIDQINNAKMRLKIFKQLLKEEKELA